MEQGHMFRRWCPIAILVLVATILVSGARADESQGDLSLFARVLQTVSGKGTGAAASGVVKIELLLQAAHETNEIDLRVATPDGTAWRLKSGPFSPGRIRWARPDGGEPRGLGDGSTSIEPRGALRAVIEVPLEGARIHEIVFEASGVGPNGPIRTTAMARVPFGVPDGLPVDDGANASFPMEVRP